MKIAFLLLSILVVVYGRTEYQFKIPNGNGLIGWPGIGHSNPYGGGRRNVFGEDFQSAGFVWTVELCQKDSDSDGLTNGEELGDPDCVWQVGDVPSRTENITHPGYAVMPDPIPETCLNTPILEDEILTTWTMSSDFIVPSTDETLYYCQNFELPEVEDDLYLTRIDYLIDSSLMHHMLLFECPKGTGQNTTYECLGGHEQCVFWGAWAPGLFHKCYPEGIALKLNKDKQYSIQFHYNNPEHVSGTSDTSGFTMHLTQTKPVEEVGSVYVGDVAGIVLPPGRRDTLSYECASACTEYWLPRSGVNILTTFLHAHYRGSDLWMSLNEKNLTVDSPYHYDFQHVIIHSPTVNMTPGDTMTMNCKFDTTHDTETVHGGLGTNDEMCIGLVEYYPSLPMHKSCSTLTRENFHDGKPFHFCGVKFDAETGRQMYDCEDTERIDLVNSLANAFASSLCEDICSEECIRSVDEWRDLSCVYTEGASLFLYKCSQAGPNQEFCQTASQKIRDIEQCGKLTENEETQMESTQGTKPTTPEETQAEISETKDISSGVYIAVGIAVVLVIIGIAGIIFMVLRKRKRDNLDFL